MNAYFYKSPSHAQPGRVDLQSYVKEFGFLDWLNDEQRRKLRALFLLDQDPYKKEELVALIADVVAAAVSQLIRIERIEPKIVLKMIRFSRDLLLDLGYKETNMMRLPEEVGPGENLTLIAGCQGRRTLRSRTLAIAECIPTIPGHFTIFPCGLRPPGEKKVQIPDESARIENLILETFPPTLDARTKFTTVNIQIESQSSSTLENVQKFLDMVKERTSSGNLQKVFLVTSTWHLPKLATLFEEQIAARGISVEKIVLVGSEQLGNLTDASKDLKYAKQALFRLYLYVLQHELLC
jgi:hypothetical protein